VILFLCRHIFTTSSKHHHKKGIWSKIKFGRSVEACSNTRKLLVKRARVAIGHTHPLILLLQRLVKLVLPGSLSVLWMKVIVEHAITLLDFSSKDFAFILQIFESQGWLPFIQPQPVVYLDLVHKIYSNIYKYYSLSSSLTIYVRGKGIDVVLFVCKNINNKINHLQ
jgi:hypothetical protein